MSALEKESMGVRRGDRVELVRTSDPYTRLQRGAIGTVSRIDGIGTVHIAWDDGGHLGMIPGEDEIQSLVRFNDDGAVYTCRECREDVTEDEVLWIDPETSVATTETGVPFHVECAPEEADYDALR